MVKRRANLDFWVTAQNSAFFVQTGSADSQGVTFMTVFLQSRKALTGLQRRPYGNATGLPLHDNGGSVATPGRPYGRMAVIFRVRNVRKTAGRPFWFEKKRMLNSQNYEDFLTSFCFLPAVTVAECFSCYFFFLKSKETDFVLLLP